MKMHMAHDGQIPRLIPTLDAMDAQLRSIWHLTSEVTHKAQLQK